MLQVTQQLQTGGMQESLDQIQAQTNALLALSSTGGTLTADGTEQTLYIDNEPFGAWEPICVWVNLDNMQAGDTIEIRAYHRLSDAGTLKLWDYNTYTGADGGLANSRTAIVIELYPNRHGFQVTLEQSAGVNRDYEWELFARM